MLPALGAVLVGLLTCQVALLSTTVYLHRCLSHRALTVHPAVAFAFRVILWISTGIAPREWVAVHRRHHAYTDKEGDPHSPVLEGWAKVQFGNVVLYRRAARDKALVDRYSKDLPPDRWDRVLFDHSLLGLGIGVALLVLIFGWWFALIAAVVHLVTYLLAGGAINGIGHTWGRRPYDNLATNNQWLAWLVVGEGLHNNHHAAATSARMSLAKGEIDPAWWFINLLSKMRLATVRHTDLKPRPPRAEAVPT